ncbi:aldehyde dehydrogenase family protein [Ochrobactrum pseudogrignonense]|nr:aldehyde dehydrogenase family protein [Brucella pseudogrignonensis]
MELPGQSCTGAAGGSVAAGNHVFLKPSEHTPHTSEFLRKLIADVFPDDRATVVLGDAHLSTEFSSLPFDHLFFTGSTAVGRKIMKAAAENLTPVTLELGGKSPAIIGEGASLKRAASSIATGKYFNAGQTCIAPDYVLIHQSKRDAFVTLLREETRKRYGEDQRKATARRSSMMRNMRACPRCCTMQRMTAKQSFH